MLRGKILAQDVRAAHGERAVAKGSVISDGDADRLLALPWEELHLIEPEPDELHEMPAGERVARAAAGAGVELGTFSAGAWPIRSRQRGVVSVDVEALRRANMIPGVCIYTVFDGQIVDAGELVARGKITPFVLQATRVEEMERIAGRGLVDVHAFRPLAVAAVVQETIGERGAHRFRAALAEKIAWFGATLLEPQFVEPTAETVGGGLQGQLAAGAQLVIMAGTKAMAPLDPAFLALAELGVKLDRYGVPAHPGSLLWLARVRDVPVIGMPSCGLFSQATSFDLVLPRIMAGLPVDDTWLASLGHGGLLGKETAFRFPPYRAAGDRGGVE